MRPDLSTSPFRDPNAAPEAPAPLAQRTRPVPAEPTPPPAPQPLAPSSLDAALPAVPDTPAPLMERSPFDDPNAPTGIDSAMETLRDESASPFGETLEQRRARYLDPIERRAEAPAAEGSGLARRVRKDASPSDIPTPLEHGPEADRDPARVKSMLAGFAAGQEQARTEADQVNPFAPRPTTNQEQS